VEGGPNAAGTPNKARALYGDPAPPAPPNYRSGSALRVFPYGGLKDVTDFKTAKSPCLRRDFRRHDQGAGIRSSQTERAII